MALRSGKLPLELLKDVVALRGTEDPDVRLGPAVGEDAAAVEVGERYVIATTDPITFARQEIGWYAVQVNANDVATRGARPRWFQSSLLFPPDTTSRTVHRVAREIHEACRELDVAVIGGHAEVTDAVTRVVVAGEMLGTVEKDRFLTTSGAREGDELLLTKSAGIEGTALLAWERGEELHPILGERTVERAANFLREPGLSIVPEALLAAEGGAHALHDPTEGGVAMGLHEMSLASGHVLEVEPAAIPVRPETEAVCDHFGLNAFGLLGSGALLVSLTPDRAERLLSAFQKDGIPAARIGRVGARGAGIEARGEGPYPLEASERDEIARVV